MGFPRAAPLKPKKINRMAQFKVGGGVVAWVIGFCTVGEYVFDLFRPVKEFTNSLMITDGHMKRPGDIRYIREQIKELDEAAKFDLMPGSQNKTAEQMREAKLRYEDAQLTNEVREFFFEKSKNEKNSEGDSDKFTNIKKVDPGVYGKVIVTRSPDKKTERKNDANEVTK